MRHSLFMSTMQDSGVKKQKRWRPGKKLVTDPDSLKHTLQDVADEEGEQGSAAAVMQMGDVREGGGKRKGGETGAKECVSDSARTYRADGDKPRRAVLRLARMRPFSVLGSLHCGGRSTNACGKSLLILGMVLYVHVLQRRSSTFGTGGLHVCLLDCTSINR